jgi:hypothetical protein
MWTTHKRLWLDKDGKPTGTERNGVEFLAGEWDRVALSVEDAKRLGLTGRAAKDEPAESEPKETT